MRRLNAWCRRNAWCINIDIYVGFDWGTELCLTKSVIAAVRCAGGWCPLRYFMQPSMMDRIEDETVRYYISTSCR
jgi:hypothetical protein